VKRAVALLVAIGLIVGAIAIRRAIDDDGDDSAGPADPPSSSTGIILCAADLGDVCAALTDVKTEPPAQTVDRLVKGEPLNADAWLVAAPWPQVALERAARRGQALALRVPDTPLARSPLSFYVRGGGVASAIDQCGVSIDWKCLSTKSVRIDFEDPATSTAGLLSVVQQATAFFGSAEFGSNDFGLFERELAQLKTGRATAPSGTTVFERFGLFTHADVLVTLHAVGERQLLRAQFEGKLTPRGAAPTISADAVLVGAREPAKKTTDDVRSQLSKAGWATDNLPPTTALPTADVIIALQDLWKGLR
jgi:hypothetical protein